MRYWAAPRSLIDDAWNLDASGCQPIKIVALRSRATIVDGLLRCEARMIVRVEAAKSSNAQPMNNYDAGPTGLRRAVKDH